MTDYFDSLKLEIDQYITERGVWDPVKEFSRRIIFFLKVDYKLDYWVEENINYMLKCMLSKKLDKIVNHEFRNLTPEQASQSSALDMLYYPHLEREVTNLVGEIVEQLEKYQTLCSKIKRNLGERFNFKPYLEISRKKFKLSFYNVLTEENIQNIFKLIKAENERLNQNQKM